MIFLDATGTCRSPKNTGMQRMTRQIFLELKKHTAIQPISWNAAGRCYQQLGRRELKTLEAPFRKGARATARPDLRGEHFLAEMQRLAFRKRVSLPAVLKTNDVFFVPDLYRDARIAKIPQLIRETSARSVAIFHDAASLRLGILSSRGQARFRKYIDSLGAFDLVICISHESADDLHRRWEEMGTKPTKTCVETWPIEFDARFRSARAAEPRNLVLCVGSFEPRKNHLTLLRAAEKLWERDVHFDLELVGRATGYYGPTITTELRRLKRRARPVRWLRHVDEATLHRAYAACRFSVYPSLMEGFGLPVLESLWHGKPCICGSNGALGEVATGGGCVLVDQQNEDSLGNAIAMLLKDKDQYERLCAEARARRFRTWNDYIHRLLHHLDIVPNE